MSLTKGYFDRDCTDKCKSKQHGDELSYVITKRCVTDSDLCAYMRWKCSVCAQVSDSMGRTALHFAASCGRTQLVKWLVLQRGAQINMRDLESGYTPLHRSVFYGQINAAVSLIQLGANVGQVDHNDLTPLEHAMKDRSLLADFTPNTSCQVYVWGTNTNYNLGTGSQHARQLPDLLDSFHKKYADIAIKQVCLDKFHCVLVAKDGQVFTCGHGQGGRLGLNSESTVLQPQQVRFGFAGQQMVCVHQATIGRDHSMFLTDTGQVWSCGLNIHHVLGIKPAPAQLLTPKPLVDFRKELLGVCAGRFHSVAWGCNAVYTWGLNAGQLGHARTPVSTCVTPKLVANFENDETEIVSVAASDGATVVATKRGDIFVLHEYQCRKIASKQLNVDKIKVVGGHLNSKVSSGGILIEKGGKELRVLVLQKTGNLLLWQESLPQLSRCIYSLNRPLIVRDVVLTKADLYFVTNDGEAFKGEFKTRKKKFDSPNSPQKQQKSAFHDFLDKDDCQMVRVTKFPYVHRAVAIQSDLKGRNFAVLQTEPRFLLFDIPEVSPSTLNTDLLNLFVESDEMDSIHDVIFKIADRIFPAHRYIIALNSEPLESLIESSLPETTIELSNVNPVIFKQIMLYIYTGTCDVLKLGECTNELKQFGGYKSVENLNGNENDFNSSAPKINSKKPKNKLKSNNKSLEVRDPIRLLQESSKRFGVKSLHKTLDNYVYNNGFIQLKTKKKDTEPVKFDRQSFKNLQDVVIKAENGAEISAHKCILVGRLEYFNNLFAVRWNEKSRNNISLPMSYTILDQVITYLYTDEAKFIENHREIEHIANVLIVSDQLFIDRLKEICEVALSSLVTLKNAAQLLQFSSTYNAMQLKNCAMNFVCLNLSAILESRILDTLDSELLDDLTEYYCNWNPMLSKRVITPFSEAPPDETVKSIGACFPVKEFDLENPKVSAKPVKKSKMRTRKSSENSRTKIPNELPNDDAVESLLPEPPKAKPKPEVKWGKILSEKDKHKKIVQARLRAIALTKQENELDQNDFNLTKLISAPKIIPKVELTQTSPRSSDEFSFEPSSYDIPIQKAEKLSQKQRKKLTAVISTSSLAQQLDNVNKNVTKSFTDILNKMDQKKDIPDASSPKSPWQKIDVPTVTAESPKEAKPAAVISTNQKASPCNNHVSNSDILNNKVDQKKDIPDSSSPKNPWQKIELPAVAAESPNDTKPNILDIIAEERKQKENWSKMRTRPLQFSQMEDKAVRELERFYNVDQVSDEYITVHKVKKRVFAVPLWVHSNTKH